MSPKAAEGSPGGRHVGQKGLRLGQALLDQLSRAHQVGAALEDHQDRGETVLGEFSTTEPARKTIPASALFYDEQGMAWVFTKPEPLVFIRHPMSVDFVLSDQAVLTDVWSAVSPWSSPVSIRKKSWG